MAARRKKKTRTAAATAEVQAPPPRRRSLVRGAVTLFGLPVLTALLLTLAFPPAEVSWLAYLAPVPMLVMVARSRCGRDAFWASLAGGIVFFGLNLEWIRPITWAGYLAVLPYLALYWGVFGWVARRIARATGAPMTLLAPVVWVALEMVRGWLLSGLPWIFVAHTQYENLVLIQTADLVGAYGASFLCLMTAGLATDLLVRPIFIPSAGGAPPRLSRTLVLMAALTLAAWGFTIGYGLWRLHQDGARPGPVVASVQTCIPQSVKNMVKTEQVQTAADLRREMQRIEQAEHEMLDGQLRLTEDAAALARQEGLPLDLIVWPETMVPGIVNQAFLEYDAAIIGDYPRLAQLQARSRGYWEQVREASRAAGAPILFGGHSAALEHVGADALRFADERNAAFLVAPQTPPYGAEGTYAKAHLVPFGEYVPFKESWPWLNQQLQALTPFDYDYSLTPGRPDQPPLVVPFDGRQARFQVAICYEDAMAYRIREMVRPAEASGGKAVDFIVNISNDGWFNGSIELDQHLNLCVFRAVENRVAIVRSVNTGISALISPVGRIEAVVADAEGNRRNVAGRILGRLTLDDRAAPYTRLGDAFALACVAATVILWAVSLALDRRRRKEAVS